MIARSDALMLKLMRSQTSVRSYFLTIHEDIKYRIQRIDEIQLDIKLMHLTKPDNWLNQVDQLRTYLSREQRQLAYARYDLELLLELEENKRIYMRLKLEGLV